MSKYSTFQNNRAGDMTHPFFSVCIPIYNGEKTIIDALKSLEGQTFREFEVIIVDDNSTDDSYEKVKKYLEGSNISYNLYRNKENLGMVGNWKRIIEPATGKYIATLHQDDLYKSNYLNDAFKILNKYENIGIYAASNQNNLRYLKYLIEPKVYFQSTYKMEDVSPPSETIFIREFKNKPYTYNDKNYVYCPEAELYLDIANDEFKIFHNPIRSVVRCPNKKVSNVTRRMFYTWTYFVDKFKIIEKHKNHRFISKKIYQEALNNQINNALQRYSNSRRFKKGKSKEIFRNIKIIIIQKKKIIKLFELLFRKITDNTDLLTFLLKSKIIQDFLKLLKKGKKKS